MTFAKTLVLLAVFGAVQGCNLQEESFDEMSRQPSPDGKVDAVLLRRNAGATTAYTFRLHVVPIGNPVPTGDKAVLTADEISGESFRWTAANELEVTYPKTRIHGFQNYKYPLIGDGQYVTRVRLTEHGTTNFPPDMAR